MTAPDASGAQSASQDRVLVTAPFRRDAAVLQDILLQHGIVATICAEAADLAHELARGGAALVMSQEAMTERRIDVLAGYLAAQPTWSELPLVLLLDGDHQNSAVLTALRTRLPGSKLTVLQRPVRTLELVTAVQTGMAARRRQLQLRDHIVWQEELQRELNHRVKNVLANVTAIYHMTMRQNASLQDFAANFEGRLSALSNVHSALILSGEQRTVNDVAELVLAPYRSATAQRIVINGPPIDLTGQAAVTLALCLHELATNAVKYGALSGPHGTVSLTWRIESSESGAVVRLDWVESGGPPVTAPSRRGYGTSFIRSATKGMGGTIEFQFRPEGLVCEVALPWEMLAAPTAREDGMQRETSRPSGTELDSSGSRSAAHAEG